MADVNGGIMVGGLVGSRSTSAFGQRRHLVVIGYKEMVYIIIYTVMVSFNAD